MKRTIYEILGQFRPSNAFLLVSRIEQLALQHEDIRHTVQSLGSVEYVRFMEVYLRSEKTRLARQQLALTPAKSVDQEVCWRVPRQKAHLSMHCRLQSRNATCTSESFSHLGRVCNSDACHWQTHLIMLIGSEQLKLRGSSLST